MKYYEYITEYKEGLLEGNELDQFEKELKSNGKLRNAVDNYHDAKKISEALLEVDMMQTIARLAAENNVENHSPVEDINTKTSARKQVKLFSLGRIAAAASIIGLIAIAGWWLGQDSSLQREALYATYYTRPIDLDATKSVSTDGLDPLQTAKYYFALNDFEQSKTSLNNIISKTTDQDTILIAKYWLCHVHINTDQWTEAKQLLNTNSFDSDGSLLKLVQLLNGDMTEKEYLKEVK